MPVQPGVLCCPVAGNECFGRGVELGVYKELLPPFASPCQLIRGRLVYFSDLEYSAVWSFPKKNTLRKIQKVFWLVMGSHFCKRLADALYQVVGQTEQEKAQCWSCLDSREIQENIDLKCWKWNAAAWWLSSSVSAVPILNWKRTSSEPRLLEIRDWLAEIFKRNASLTFPHIHVWKAVSGYLCLGEKKTKQNKPRIKNIPLKTKWCQKLVLE